MPKSNTLTLYSADGLCSATFNEDATRRGFAPDTGSDGDRVHAAWLNDLTGNQRPDDVDAFCATYGVSVVRPERVEPAAPSAPDVATNTPSWPPQGVGDASDSVTITRTE